MSQQFEKPSGTLGGMLSSLFGRRAGMPTTGGGGLSSGKMLGGALLAAGAAYLYTRNKNRNTSPTPTVSNTGTGGVTDFLGR